VRWQKQSLGLLCLRAAPQTFPVKVREEEKRKGRAREEELERTLIEEPE